MVDAGIKDVKVQFNTREGIYKQMPISDYFYPKRTSYTTQGPASSSTPVKTSFVKVNDGKEDQDCVCLSVGRELFYFMYKSIKEHTQPLEFLDKRTYKGVAPTCHDINQKTSCAESVRVAVGFIAGQVQIIDVGTKESLQIMNEDRCVEKSRVTCVRWFPNSETMLLSSHISGYMYTYDISQPCLNVIPQYHSQPDKLGDGYMIHSLKIKNSSSGSNGSSVVTRNPVCRWTMTRDGSGVHNFAFS
uniref:Anaphase-promoting complex subunit 4 WD40 domain-containing protein n=1 Tax=Ciona savignyi TaxID=51511 RepID=H2Z5W9_CIOSA